MKLVNCFVSLLKDFWTLSSRQSVFKAGLDSFKNFRQSLGLALFQLTLILYPSEWLHLAFLDKSVLVAQIHQRKLDLLLQFCTILILNRLVFRLFNDETLHILIIIVKLVARGRQGRKKIGISFIHNFSMHHVYF